MKKSPIIFIVGPTAVGKTDVSIEVAQLIDAEIVSCDSMLVYKEPKIIVNEPSSDELKRVKHHLIDIVSVSKEFNVYQFKELACNILKQEYPEKNLIFTGGSGLYVKALLDGMFTEDSSSEQVREELIKEKEDKGLDYLYGELEKEDSEAAQKINPNDSRRIIRALEVIKVTGVKMSEKQREANGWWQTKNIRVFGLNMPRELLYERINQRTENMFRQGVVKEVEYLLSLPLSKTAGKILGVKEIREYLDKKCSLEEAEEEMKKNTRRFAKRQMTWFRKDDRIEWVDVNGRSSKDIAKDILEGIGKGKS